MAQASPEEESRVPLSWILLFFLTVFALGAFTIQTVGGSLVAGLLLA